MHLAGFTLFYYIKKRLLTGKVCENRKLQRCYRKTLNVCVPLISRAKQNRQTKGREYQLQAKNRTKLLQYFELYGFNLPK